MNITLGLTFPFSHLRELPPKAAVAGLTALCVRRAGRPHPPGLWSGGAVRILGTPCCLCAAGPRGPVVRTFHHSLSHLPRDGPCCGLQPLSLLSLSLITQAAATFSSQLIPLAPRVIPKEDSQVAQSTALIMMTMLLMQILPAPPPLPWDRPQHCSQITHTSLENRERPSLPKDTQLQGKPWRASLDPQRHCLTSSSALLCCTPRRLQAIPPTPSGPPCC